MRYGPQLALLCLLFADCAQQYKWKHGSYDQAQFQRDAYECDREERQSGYFGTGLIGEMNAAKFAERCMVARGYYKVPKE